MELDLEKMTRGKGDKSSAPSYEAPEEEEADDEGDDVDGAELMATMAGQLKKGDHEGAWETLKAAVALAALEDEEG